MMPLSIGVLSFAVSCLCTIAIIGVARTLGIVDQPKGGRKIHKTAMPLLGGVGMYVAVTLVIGLLILRTDALTLGEINAFHYTGIILAGLVLVIGGVLDDAFDLSPKVQILFPILAALLAILGGLDIEKLTNPFGGYLYLDAASWQLGTVAGYPIALSWPGDLLVFLWLLGMMFTTKLLDGLDGLATSIGSVGALMVLLLASSVAYFQPDVVVLSSVLLGVFLGFLFWNRHPAKVFLGESGALLVGFWLGALAVISGGKIATLLLVAGIPVLDVIWVIARRFKRGKKVTKGDRLHLHHRLLDKGLTQGQIVLLYTGIALVFGLLTLVLSSFAKLIALAVLGICMLAGGTFLLNNETTKL